MSTTARGSPIRRVPRGPSSDQRLLEELERTAERIRVVDLATAGVVLAVVWAVYLLAVAVADQALRPAGLPNWIRQGLFVLLIVGSGGYAWLHLIRPAFQKVSLLYAAWRLEKSARVTRHAMTAYLDLRERPLPRLVREALRREAQEDLRYADPEAAAPHNQAMRWFFVLVALLILLGIFALFVPEQFLSLMARAFWPFAGTVIPPNTRFELLAPQRDGPYLEPHRQSVLEIPVKRSEPVTVHVRVHGLAPAEAWLETWVQEGEQPYRRPMTAVDDYRTEWKFTLGASDLPASGLFFRVVGGDGQSRVYRLVEQLTNPPEVREFDITIHYPAYTARELKKQTIGALEVLIGSEIELAVFGDQPVASGELVLEYGEPVREEKFDLVQVPQEDPDHQPNRVALKTPLRVEEAWLPKARYGIRLRNKLGQTGGIQWYDIQVIRDQPPVITLDQVNRVPLPAADPQAKELPTVQVPLGATVPVEGTANDDFAVDCVWLVLQELEGQRRLFRVAHDQAETGPLQKANGFTPIVPAHYSLTLDAKRLVAVDQSRETPQGGAAVTLPPGTKLKLWVEGTDCKRPEPNVARSREVIVELIAPDKPPQQPDASQKPNPQDKPEQKPNGNPQDQPRENKPEPSGSQNQPDQANKPNAGQPPQKPDKAPPGQANPDKTSPDAAQGNNQPGNKPNEKPNPDKSPMTGDSNQPQKPDNAAGGSGQSQDNRNPDKVHTNPGPNGDNNNPQKPSSPQGQGNKPGGNQQPNQAPSKPSGTPNDQPPDKAQPSGNAGNQSGAKPQQPNANGGPTGQTPDKPMASNNPAGGEAKPMGTPDANTPSKPSPNNPPAQSGNNSPNSQNSSSNSSNPQNSGNNPSNPQNSANKPSNPQGPNAQNPNAQPPNANNQTPPMGAPNAQAGNNNQPAKPSPPDKANPSGQAGNQQPGNSSQPDGMKPSGQPNSGQAQNNPNTSPNSTGQQPGNNQGQQANQPGNNQGNPSGNNSANQQGNNQGSQPGNNPASQSGNSQSNQSGGNQANQPGGQQQPGQGQPGQANAGQKPEQGQKPGSNNGGNQQAGNKPADSSGANAGQGQQQGQSSAQGNPGGQNNNGGQGNTNSNANNPSQSRSENSSQPGKPGAGPGGANPEMQRRGEAGDSPLESTPMKPNPEFANEAGDLTLDSLRKKLERGEIDKPTRELMDRLGVKTPEELRRLLQNKPEVVQAEMGRGNRPAVGPTRSATRDHRAAPTDANDRPVLPPELRDAYEDFTRRFRPQ